MPGVVICLCDRFYYCSTTWPTRTIPEYQALCYSTNEWMDGQVYYSDEHTRKYEEVTVVVKILNRETSVVFCHLLAGS